ncbi:class I SAM-dependent DNA methyltransferase [Ornithinimicrobium sp. LYQ92]|uniref:class I SAM-dependent DNA methyltransferase n=1 Tax=Serinicoccus sp. LYQ92 TaxID=3378798 RepID=UPI003852E806
MPASTFLGRWTRLLVVSPHRDRVPTGLEALCADASRAGVEVVVSDDRPGHASSGSPSGRTLVIAPWTSEEPFEQHGADVEVAHHLSRDGAAEHAELPWSRLLVLEASPEVACAPHPDGSAPPPLIPGCTVLVTRRDASGESLDRPHLEPRPQPRGATFDAMFDDGEDPWDSGSWYERRKRALTLAMLQRPRYARVLDLGCSTGVLTRELAGRADVVTGVDASARALAVAGRDTPPGVVWVHGEAPAVLEGLDHLDDVALLDHPDLLDLAVVSEVGYFLTPFEWWLTLGALVRRLAPGGELVLVHWRHATADIPLDGPSVHAAARTVLAPLVRSRHEDPDFLVDTFGVAP